MGCAGKYEMTKKGEMKEFLCEIDVFREENGHILSISDFRQ